MLTNNLAQWTLFSFIACTELADKTGYKDGKIDKKNMQMLKVRTFHQEFILDAQQVNCFLQSQQQLITMIVCD